MQVRVVDSEMNDVPRDMQTIGEIVTCGDHVMEGYFREPDATASVMTGPWFHTGDMAVWDQESFIQIVDRKKEIIISGGENISSIEVEKAIFAHPEVLECAVVAAPDETWGEIPAAIVVRKPGSALTSDELLQFLTARLGKFKLPRIIAFSDEALPKTGTGKIRKLVLREQFWQGKSQTGARLAPFPHCTRPAWYSVYRGISCETGRGGRMKLAFLLAITASILAAQFGQIPGTYPPGAIHLAKIQAAIRTVARLAGAAPGEPLARSSRPPIPKLSAAWCEKWTPIRSNWKPKIRAF